MKKLKKIFSKNFILPFRNDAGFIFIYHDISDTYSSQHSKNYSTTIKRINEQIDFLSNHFTRVDLNEFHNSKSFKNNVATIVFFDSFKSVMKNTQLYLNSKNIPFSVFDFILNTHQEITYIYTWNPLNVSYRKALSSIDFMKNPCNKGSFSYKIFFIIYSKNYETHNVNVTNIANYDLQPIVQVRFYE